MTLQSINEHRRSRQSKRMDRFEYARICNEGQRLLRLGENEQAIKYLNMALSVEPKNVDILVNRSMAYWQIGSTQKALLDANNAVETNPNNYKAVKQKANLHFLLCEFELSLLWYHRGIKLRPSDDEFSFGIDRAEYTMWENFGLNSPLRIIPTRHTKSQEDVLRVSKTNPNRNELRSGLVQLTMRSSKETSTNKKFLAGICKEEKARINKYKEMTKNRQKMVNISVSRIKQNKLLPKIPLPEPEEIGINSAQIEKVARQNLMYLEPKSKFWKYQLNYKYRLNLNKQDKQNIKAEGHSPLWDIQTIVLEMVRAEMFEFENKHEKVIKICQNIISKLEYIFDKKNIFYHNLLSDQIGFIGCCYIKLNQYDKAIEWFEKDLEIGNRYGLKESISRSQCYIGWIYYKLKKYDKTIQIFEEKFEKSNVKGIMEHCWLAYILCKCFLNTSNNHDAVKWAKVATEMAIRIMNDKWTLKCYIQLADAYYKVDDVRRSIHMYYKVLDIVEELELDESERKELEDWIELVRNRSQGETKSKKAV